MDSKVKSRAEAAIRAGYPPKNARQPANQAFNQILSKGPEAMREAGLNLPVMIGKYLRPLLEATEIKLAQYEGEFTDYVELADNTTRRFAIDMGFRLLGAYPAEDPVMNSKITVDVIIADMPRPNYDVEPIDIEPGPIPEAARRQLVSVEAGPAEPPEPPKPKKKDPRPSTDQPWAWAYSRHFRT